MHLALACLLVAQATGLSAAAVVMARASRTPPSLARGDRVVRFIESYCTHVKGPRAGHRIILATWQRDDLIRPLFGTIRPDGRRQYRYAYIEIPRKNGKSTKGACVGLYLTFADGEPGAEVYSVAADKDQGRFVFDLAKAMVEAHPALRKRARVYRDVIAVPGKHAFYKVISAEAYTKHGMNPHGIIFDELHAQPDRELWDVLTTSIGARLQPLVFAITTAGFDRHSICFEQHDYAEKVLHGVVPDPTYFAYIRSAPETADWRDERVWRRANPAVGDFRELEELREKARRAEHVPALQNTFRRLYLNQWVKQESRWLDLAKWDACAASVDARALAGRRCYSGLDLASTTDIAACVLVFPDDRGECYDVLPFFWVPEETVIERARLDRVPYDVWVTQGLITATEGNVIHYAAIRQTLEALAETYDIREIAFDRWGAVQLSQELTDAGLTLIPFGQGFRDMSPPTKELLNLVLATRLRHGGHPVLRWMADNLVVSQDPAGNVKPNKAKSTQRIDGMVALIMAIDRATRHEGESAYADGAELLMV